MSKSKISVGSHSVAQAFGMSTMPLMWPWHRRGAEDRVGLGAGVAELLQVLDRVEAGLAIGDVDVEVVLLALLVDRDAFEDQVIVVVRPIGLGLKIGFLMPYFAMPPLISSTLQMQPARHLDGAAEGDLAVALGEVEVAHREPGALHVDREVDLRAARQVLDVAVAAVLARRHRARAFGRDLGLARRP